MANAEEAQTTNAGGPAAASPATFPPVTNTATAEQPKNIDFILDIPMNVAVYKDVLLRKRAELAASAGVKPLSSSMEHNNGRQGDMADQASGNNEVHIALKLKQTDAKILQAIDEALVRIDKGVFGVCRDCGDPIAEARLNAIPWTRVCISCKEKQKA